MSPPARVPRVGSLCGHWGRGTGRRPLGDARAVLSHSLSLPLRPARLGGYERTTRWVRCACLHC